MAQIAPKSDKFTKFGECLNYKSALKILIWPLEVPVFLVTFGQKCPFSALLCVDTFHSVIFHLCKYRRGDSSRKLFRENLPFSLVLNQQFHFRLNYHNFFDYFIMLLSMFKHFREEYVVQQQCQARPCESFNDIEINSRLQQGFFIS